MCQQRACAGISCRNYSNARQVRLFSTQTILFLLGISHFTLSPPQRGQTVPFSCSEFGWAQEYFSRIEDFEELRITGIVIASKYPHFSCVFDRQNQRSHWFVPFSMLIDITLKVMLCDRGGRHRGAPLMNRLSLSCTSTNKENLERDHITKL